MDQDLSIVITAVNIAFFGANLASFLASIQFSKPPTISKADLELFTPSLRIPHLYCSYSFLDETLLPRHLKHLFCRDRWEQWRRNYLARKCFYQWKKLTWRKKGWLRITSCQDDIILHPLSFKVQKMFIKFARA